MRLRREVDPADENLLHEEQAQAVQYWHEEELIGMLHWVQGRNVVHERPREHPLMAPGLLGIVCGELACFKSVSEPARAGLHNRYYFPDFDHYHVSGDGWLIGTGPTAAGAAHKTFRRRLLPVLFKKLELLHQSPATLTLKILNQHQ